MILNVSGRTDIIAFYTKWFINRYKEGYVDVRNPFYPKNISRIYFKDVDAIFFCTKNPLPIIDFLKEIEKPIIFHITITPYKEDIEPNVPSKKNIIEVIKQISTIIGIDNISIRYDPIFLSGKYNLEYHKKAFNKICTMLDGYVNQIIISFLDEYKNVKKNKTILNYKEITKEEYKEIGIYFSKVAKEHNMTVQTCFEEETLVEYGFKKGECISHELAYKITGKKYKKWTARKGNKCNCIEMVDIGTYNSCNHLCKYCYANYNEEEVKNNIQNHNPNSSLLIGNIKSDDIIKIRNK